MPSHDHFDGYAECTVCRSDTRELCSPCGDPVCQNCACPNGCASAAGVTDAWGATLRELPPEMSRQAA